jgi:hypothetical protein
MVVSRLFFAYFYEKSGHFRRKFAAAARQNKCIDVPGRYGQTWHKKKRPEGRASNVQHNDQHHGTTEKLRPPRGHAPLAAAQTSAGGQA